MWWNTQSYSRLQNIIYVKSAQIDRPFISIDGRAAGSYTVNQSIRSLALRPEGDKRLRNSVSASYTALCGYCWPLCEDKVEFVEPLECDADINSPLSYSPKSSSIDDANYLPMSVKCNSV